MQVVAFREFIRKQFRILLVHRIDPTAKRMPILHLLRVGLRFDRQHNPARWLCDQLQLWMSVDKVIAPSDKVIARIDKVIA